MYKLNIKREKRSYGYFVLVDNYRIFYLVKNNSGYDVRIIETTIGVAKTLKESNEVISDYIIDEENNKYV